MKPRVVVPELLDHLPADAPEAIRSRSDLRRINILMGNTRWILQTAKKFPRQALQGIAEIGAGDGELCADLHHLYPQAPITAYDLADRPPHLSRNVVWKKGDLMTADSPTEKGILVANLFLHHFEPPALRDIGKWLGNFSVLLINEPDRASLPHLLGNLMHPLINHVTRHDMHVSIRAGFSTGEIPSFLGLDSAVWKITEKTTWRGARRVIAWRD